MTETARLIIILLTALLVLAYIEWEKNNAKR